MFCLVVVLIEFIVCALRMSLYELTNRFLVLKISSPSARANEVKE